MQIPNFEGFSPHGDSLTVEPIRIALVGCAKRKLKHAAPARELYSSALFRGSLKLAEGTCEEVLIASALHGLVELDTVLEPYEHKLARSEGEAWSARVVDRLRRLYAEIPFTVRLFMGAEYARPLSRRLHQQGIAFAEPLRGLQLGARLSHLKKANAS